MLDDPVTPEELNRSAAKILYDDEIGKNELAADRFGLSVKIDRPNGDFDVAGDRGVCGHGSSISLCLRYQPLAGFGFTAKHPRLGHLGLHFGQGLIDPAKSERNVVRRNDDIFPALAGV